MVDIVVGEPNVRVRVKMTNKNGQETDTYQVGTIQWTSTDDSVAAVTDDDADPKDARVDILKVGQAQIGVAFDGDPGDGLRDVSGQSEVIHAIDGQATGAEIFLEFPTV